MVYALVGSFLTFLVTIYCSYYLHREDGYKSFFNTIMLFYFGYTITVFSGNLETLFIGWEILGISSFLLIGFYRNRYLPVKNAFKVFSIYRLGDVGLILAMWACHHLFHENITFFQLQNDLLISHHLENHSIIGIFVALMILITAAAKSAQLPFSSWLPRAMEGPTPSSAIFYGSLSVHLGVFLLLRTFELWEHQTSVRVIIGLLGLTTSIVATGIARVQSSIKSQIAYASISQIGLIFIELACGFEILALIHFAGNAFLRTYQLLVSPSTVSYLIREQFYNFVPRPTSIEDSFSKKIKYTFYILSLKEFNLDTLVYKMWRPLKIMGRSLNFVNAKNVLYYFIPAYVIGLVLLFNEDYIMTVKKKGFAFNSTYFSKDDTSLVATQKVNVKLKKIEVGQAYPLNNIHFSSNSSALNDQDKNIISDFAEYLKENDQIKLAINGFTDNAGNPIENLTLSELRAKAVFEFLSSCGIERSRLSYKGFGETKPLASNETEQGKAQNRRTEFLIISK